MVRQACQKLTRETCNGLGEGFFIIATYFSLMYHTEGKGGFLALLQGLLKT